jgi:hypothetical protein
MSEQSSDEIGESGSGTAHPDPQEDPTRCSKCGTYIGMWSDDYCDGCAREIGIKEPIVRCVGCGQEGPADRMDTIDVSPEDDYYPEIEYLCPSCSGGEP